MIEMEMVAIGTVLFVFFMLLALLVAECNFRMVCGNQENFVEISVKGLSL